MSDSALNGARAARAGVDAAQLAAAGLNGPQGILEGRFGFANMMGGHADWGAVENGLGRAFRFLDTSLKPYPTCRFTHGPIAALLALKRDHRVDAGQVEGIEITTFRQSIEVSDHPVVRSRSDAILSHQHAAAWALARGAPTLSALEETAYRADDVAALRARVTVTHDPALDALYPARWPHRIVVRLTSGRSLNAETMFPPGGPDAPLDESVVISKLHELAHPVLGPRATGELMEAVDNLDCADNLQQLSGALAGTGG